MNVLTVLLLIILLNLIDDWFIVVPSGKDDMSHIILLPCGKEIWLIPPSGNLGNMENQEIWCEESEEQKAFAAENISELKTHIAQ